MLHNEIYCKEGVLIQETHNLTFKNKREPRNRKEEADLITRFNILRKKQRDCIKGFFLEL